MILLDSTWTKIREQFTEDEKVDILIGVTGDIICPRGWSVEIAKIPEPTRAKFVAALNEVKNGN